MRFSATAILVVVVFAIVLFGAKRLPDLARSLGQSMRILKSETKALREEDGPAPAPAPAEAAPKTIKAAPGAPGPSRQVADEQPPQETTQPR
ncbi:Sec-independent protein translocase subunit TatA [Kitasatospora sp. NPDC057223]|uniref:Sec-independent protein translocase subunit TatA n=1 Tax=Kitasatospora sp. NPDC057223 TaxID=3346055 RepID=UPI0036281950